MKALLREGIWNIKDTACRMIITYTTGKYVALQTEFVICCIFFFGGLSRVCSSHGEVGQRVILFWSDLLFKPVANGKTKQGTLISGNH